jgi:hypothetical protein
LFPLHTLKKFGGRKPITNTKKHQLLRLMVGSLFGAVPGTATLMIGIVAQMCPPIFYQLSTAQHLQSFV